MEEIKIADMERVLINRENVTPRQSERFLQAVSGSLDHELANRAEDPDAVTVRVPDGSSFLTLGIVPEETLVDSVVASTGLTQEKVRTYLGDLDHLLRERITDLQEPLELEGFGTFYPRSGNVVYKPLAFEFIRKP